MKHLLKTALFAFVAVALVVPALAEKTKEKEKDGPSVAGCLKMKCIGKDGSGNLVCTMGDKPLLATRVEKDKDHVYFKDKDGSLVDPATGDVLHKAFKDADGKVFYKVGDKGDAMACAGCALGWCKPGSCSAAKGSVCSATACAADGKAHVHAKK